MSSDLIFTLIEQSVRQNPLLMSEQTHFVTQQNAASVMAYDAIAFLTQRTFANTYLLKTHCRYNAAMVRVLINIIDCDILS